MNLKRCLPIVLIVLVNGCAHQLQLRNTSQYTESAPYIKKTITLGVTTPATDEQEIFIDYIVDELYSLPNCKVIYPYVVNDENPVDYIINIQASPKYRGSGMNFIISWPGFLIFTPAWNGFEYFLDINTDVKIRDFATGNILMSKNYNTKYKCNQAEFDRTFIEISWFEYSIIAFIGGILNTSYDNDITDDFNTAVSRVYGNYIARNIGKFLQNI
jgi:hypothetical protein